MNILWVCSGGVNRSPAMASYGEKNYPGFTHRYAGLMGPSGQTTVHREILDWADRIFCAAWNHASYIHDVLPEHYHKVEVVGISDEYDVGDPQLQKLIELWDRTVNPFGAHEPHVLVLETNELLDLHDFALKLYKEGTPIVYCDLEGVTRVKGDYYLVDECGNQAWIDPSKYKVKVL